MNQQEWIKIFVLMTKLIGAIILVTLGKRFRNQARWVALAVSLVSLALFIAYLPALQAGANTPFELDYMPALGIKLSLNIDWLSFPFLLTIRSGISKPISERICFTVCSYSSLRVCPEPRWQMTFSCSISSGN